MRGFWHDRGIAHVGNGYGYATMTAALAHALTARGWEWTGGATDAEVVWQACQASAMERVPGAEHLPHVLVTMTETEEVPSDTRRGLDRADLILTPSSWSRGVLMSATEKPVAMIGCGVDPDVFKPPPVPRPRTLPFRWLWVGAPNFRKGLDVLMMTWNGAFAAHGDKVELYLKTSHGSRPEQIEREQNVITDWRRLSTEQLVSEIYWPAHGFVLPTGGEGWGLVAHEALATALPAVMTDVPGMRDFAAPGTFTSVKGRPVRTETSDGTIVTSSWVDPPVLAEAMRLVMARYPEAAAAADSNADNARRWTWERTAERADAACALRLGLVGTRPGVSLVA